jgi:2-deoxy-D-gluconate 3-dehydrogenase
VAIAGRNAAKNAKARAELEAIGNPVHVIEADVIDEAACRAMVDEAAARFDGLDILVNNAGVANGGRPETMPMDTWRLVLNANLEAVFVGCQAAHRHFKARGRGKIINIGSMYSLFGSPFSAAYGASKGGVVQLSKSLAVTWARDNIQVNVILPGWIESEMTAGAMSNEAFSEQIVRRTPARRWGTPADFEGPAVFLASKASDFVTGDVLSVDGGFASD